MNQKRIVIWKKQDDIPSTMLRWIKVWMSYHLEMWQYYCGCGKNNFFRQEAYK